MADIRVRHAADGTRYVRPYLGTNPVTGAPIRPYRSFPEAASDEEARGMAEEWLMGLPAARSGAELPLADALERHVGALESSGAPANTVRTYRRYAAYAAPLGRLAARGVEPWHVDELYRALLTRGPEGGEGPLSASTVMGLHWFLSGAFRHLVAVGAADSNPCDAATRPRPDRREAASLDAASMAMVAPALEEAAFADASSLPERRRRACAFAAWLALNAGLRCGEACAIRRCDAELFRRSLHVAGTVVEGGVGARRQADTKGHRARNVALAPEVAEGLRSQVLWAEGVSGRGRGAPVVTWDGSFPRPSAVAREFRAICDEIGAPRGTSFHTLRHTHATWLLLNGVDPKVVSERLGHADVATTLRIYGHVLPGRDEAAALAFSEARDGATESWRKR